MPAVRLVLTSEAGESVGRQQGLTRGLAADLQELACEMPHFTLATCMVTTLP
jgi:hypothetical protein